MKNFWTYENRLIFILSLTFGFLFFDRNAAGYLAPFIQPDLGLNNTQIGLMASALSFTWATAGYFLGLWSDRTGKRKAYLVSMIVIFSLCSFVSGIAVSFAMLLAARLAMGAAEGPFLPLAQSMILVEFSEHRRGANMGWLQSTGSALLGSCLAPIVVVALAQWLSWRTTFFLVGIPGLAMAFVISRYVREPLARTTPASEAASANLSVWELIRYRNMWVCMLMSVFMVAWMVLGWVMLPVYFVNYRHIDPFTMSLLVSMLGLSNASFGGIVPTLSDRFGRKPMMIIFSFLSVICPLAALYYTGSPWILGLLLFLGFCGGGVFPMMMATIPSETVPARCTARAIGMVQGFGEILGGVGGPFIGGWAADRYGLTAPEIIATGCAIAAGLLAFLLVETAPAKLRAGAALPQGLARDAA